MTQNEQNSVNESDRHLENKTKVGVMTFWESQENYGQLLQAYAFQTMLKKKGYDPFLIRYNKALSVKKHKPGLVEKMLHLNWRKALDPKAVQRKLGRMLRKPTPAPNRGFGEFKAKHLQFSPTLFTSYKELQAAPPAADVYITGSDQVWNYRFIGDFEPYFLQFGEEAIRRISYAASFGHKELPASVKLRFKRYLEAFDSISVREASGVSLCKNMGIESARMLPDPTLLLEREEWVGLSIDDERFSSAREKKVFVYTLGNRSSDTKDHVIHYLKQRTDTTVVHVSVHNDKSGNAFPTIQEWLGYVKNCDLVVTNSFHGMLFSTIFNKNFIGLPSTGDKAGMNERLLTLVTEFGLENQLLYGYDKSEVNKMMNLEVNWDVVNHKVRLLRNEASKFLNFA